MTEPLCRSLTATTKTEEGGVFVHLRVNETKHGRWRDEGSVDGLCLVFKSTNSGLAWPPFSGSLIYPKWSITAAFSVAR